LEGVKYKVFKVQLSECNISLERSPCQPSKIQISLKP
jgi:hypothetical protein